MNIDETRWMMHHFDDDRLERESVRLTWELMQTVAVIAFALLIWRMWV